MNAGVSTSLTAGWRLHAVRVPDAQPMPPELAVTVPGCVHTDLLAAGLIPDPFLDANELLVQWVAASDRAGRHAHHALGGAMVDGLVGTAAGTDHTR